MKTRNSKTQKPLLSPLHSGVIALCLVGFLTSSPQAGETALRKIKQTGSSPQTCISGLLFEALKDLGLTGRSATSPGKLFARVGHWSSLSQERYLDGDSDHGFTIFDQDPDSLAHLSAHASHLALARVEVRIGSGSAPVQRFHAEIGVELKNITDARGVRVVKTECSILPRVRDRRAKLRMADGFGNDFLEYPRFR